MLILRPRTGAAVACRLLNALLLLALLLPAGCRTPWSEAKAQKARQDATAILHSLREPDMLRYRALTLPPAEHQRLQRQWPQIQQRLALDASGGLRKTSGGFFFAHGMRR